MLYIHVWHLANFIDTLSLNVQCMQQRVAPSATSSSKQQLLLE